MQTFHEQRSSTKDNIANPTDQALKKWVSFILATEPEFSAI